MCTRLGHSVGEIAGKVIQATDWDKAISAFEAKVEDFNTRGMRVQIPHPGFATKFKFCPNCGSSLERFVLRDLSWKPI
jgi:hypothetical protein